MVAHAGFGDSDCIRPLIGECSLCEVDDSHIAVLGIDGECSTMGYIGRLVENLYLALIGIYPLAEDECNGLESLHLSLGGRIGGRYGDSGLGSLLSSADGVCKGEGRTSIARCIQEVTLGYLKCVHSILAGSIVDVEVCYVVPVVIIQGIHGGYLLSVLLDRDDTAANTCLTVESNLDMAE